MYGEHVPQPKELGNKGFLTDMPQVETFLLATECTLDRPGVQFHFVSFVSLVTTVYLVKFEGANFRN